MALIPSRELLFPTRPPQRLEGGATDPSLVDGVQQQTEQGVDRQEGFTVISPATKELPGKTRPPVMQAGGAIFRSESFSLNVVGLAARAYELTQIPKGDPDFWLTIPSEEREEMTDGLEGVFKEYVLQGRSREDIEFRRQRALKQQADSDIIKEFAEGNFSGTMALTLGALLLDPASWASLPGQVKAVKGLAEAGRMVRDAEGRSLVRSNFGDELSVYAAQAAVYELPAQANQIERDTADMILNVTANMALSPVMTRAYPGLKNFSLNLDNAIRNVNNPQMKVQLPKEEPKPSLSETGDSIDILIDTRLNEIEANKLPELDVDSFRKKIGKTISNFMDRSWLTNPSVAGDFKRAVAAENNRAAEFVLRDIISDGSGQYNNTLSAADYKHTYDHKYTTAIDDLRFIYHDYIESKINPTTFNNLSAQLKDSIQKQHKTEFDNKVMELRNTAYYMNQDSPEFANWEIEQRRLFPVEMKAYDVLDQQFGTISRDRIEVGEPGADAIDPNRKGYMPRITSREKFFERTMDAKGDKAYSGLYEKAFRDLGAKNQKIRLDNLTEKLRATKTKAVEAKDAKAKEKLEAKVKELEAELKTVASSDLGKYGQVGLTFYKNLKEKQYGHYTDLNSALTSSDPARLKEIVGNDDIVAEILEAQRIAAQQKGKSSRVQARIGFDVNTSTTVDGQTYKLSDLYESSLDNLVAKYGREAAGRVALAKKGIKSESDWQALSLKVAQGSKDIATVDKLNEDMAAIWDMMINRPIDGAMSRDVRMLKEYTSSLLMGRSGLAQTADIAMVAAETGTLNTAKALVKSFKIKDQIRKLPEGERKQLLKETETLFSGRFSRDHILNNPVLDRIAGDSDNRSSLLRNKVDNALGHISTHLYYLNGMNHVKAFEQGLALRSSISKLEEIVTTGKGLDRLSDYGFDKPLVDNIKKELAKGTIVKGELGGIVDLQLPKWSNRKEAEKMAVAIRKWNGSMIQETIVGENVLGLQKNVGGLLFHIMQFPIIAMQKQTQKNIRHMDAVTLNFALTATIMGTLIGYIQYGIRNTLRGDSWDDDDITWDEALKAGMMYNPAIGTTGDALNVLAAIGIIPREYSPASFFTQDEGFGGFSPNSLLNATTSVEGIVKPTMAVSKILQGLAGEEDPDEVLRAVKQAMPLQNTFLIEGFYQAIKPLAE